jgi:hypothetical protein
MNIDHIASQRRLLARLVLLAVAGHVRSRNALDFQQS